MNDHFKVGYGKPPKSTQFKQGQPSANPRGRPKKARTVPPGTAIHLATLKEVIDTPVKTADGKKIHVLVAVHKRLVKQALDGDVASIKELFRQVALIPNYDPAKEHIDIEKTLNELFKLSGLGPYVPEPEGVKGQGKAAATGDPPGS